MRRPTILITMAVAAMLAVAGCAQKEGGDVDAVSGLGPTSPGPVPTSSPTGSPTGSPSKSSPSPADPYTLSVEGIGPYRFDADPTVAGLDATGKITDVMRGNEVCPANWFAKGTGIYTDVQLMFTAEEKLDLVLARGTKIHTPSGAKVGDNLEKLKQIYGDRGQTLSNGGAKAYIVITSTGKALYFELDDDKVFVIIAGDGERLKQRFLTGADC